MPNNFVLISHQGVLKSTDADPVGYSKQDQDHRKFSVIIMASAYEVPTRCPALYVSQIHVILLTSPGR